MQNRKSPLVLTRLLLYYLFIVSKMLLDLPSKQILVNHENVSWLCDIGNFGAVDEDCSAAVSRLLPSLCFVHAKDCFVRSSSLYHPGRGFVATKGRNFRRATILGHGDVPVYQILRAIAASGYDGYVSIEHEGIEDNLLALEIGSENLKRMLSDLDREAQIGK